MAAPDRVRNIRVAALAGVTAAAMVGLAYASVPLYRLFCQVTGFGGTTQRADAAPGADLERMHHHPLRCQYGRKPRLDFPCRRSST